ncbi:MAG: sulfurtransferase [Cyanobacteria bacterium P01_G01_bin.54]
MKPLISVQALASAMSLHPPSELTIIDCRFQLQDPHWGRKQYCQNHIPGAYYLDLNQDLSAPPNPQQGRHPLPNAQQFAQTMTRFGIRQNQTQVVVYDQAQPMFAARLWWLLRYWGHPQVQVLDGGWQAWQAAGYASTTEVPPSALKGQFVTQPQPDWVITQPQLAQQLQTNPATLTLVDCRDAPRYAGQVEPIDPIAGHIPSAINRPWRRSCTAQGYLRSPQEIQQQWSDLDLHQPTTLYCGSGVTACVNLLALAHAELPQPQLYPGGWSAWCRQLPTDGV